MKHSVIRHCRAAATSFVIAAAALAAAAAPATNALTDAPFTIKDALDRAHQHEKAFAESGTYPTMLFRSVVRGEDGDGTFWTVRYEGNRYGEWPDIELRVRPSGEIRETVSKSDFSTGRLSTWSLLAYCEAAGIDLSTVSAFEGTPRFVVTNVVEEIVDGETVRMLSVIASSKPSLDDPLGVVVWTNASVRVTDRLLFEARTNRFARLAAQADRIVVRDGGYTCHSKNVDEQPVLATITNAAEIAAFNGSLRFKPQPPGRGDCMCCGYPGIDWWAGDRKIILSNVQHCHALRWSGFGGDMPLVKESAAKLKDWLIDHGVRVR